MIVFGGGGSLELLVTEKHGKEGQGSSSLSFLTLAAQNRETRIAQFPELRAWNRQKFHSEKQKTESNRNKVESRKIDSELPSESHDSELPIQCH